MLNVIYDFYFMQAKLRWRMFGAAVGAGVLYGVFAEFVVRCSEDLAAKGAAVLIVAFFLLHHIFTVILQDLPTGRDFLEVMRKADQMYAQSHFLEAFDLYSELAGSALIDASRQDRIELLIKFARANRTIGNLDSSILLLEQALELAQPFDDGVRNLILFWLAKGHFEQENLQRAVALFEEFIALHGRPDSKTIESLLYLYQSYWKLGNIPHARRCEEHTLDLMNDLPDLRIRYLEDARLTFGLASG